jgi:hypothetical protein
MTMTATRLSPLGLKVLVLGLLVTVARSPAVSAQNMGPDPFRPYNNQYDAFVFPMGPNGADAAMAAAMMRSGLRGANQFQNYLSEVQGLGRSGAEKYGQGLPYYRSAIDPAYGRALNRDYRPNADAARSFEERQQELTAKYLAYFEERDPKKRAQLLREYQTLRRQTTRALSVRRGRSSELLGSAARNEAGRGDRSSLPEGDRETQPTTRSKMQMRRPSDPATGASTRSDAPPPPRRSTRSPSSSGSTRSPSEVLDRATRRMESLRGMAPDRSRTNSAPDRKGSSRTLEGGSSSDN